MNPRITLAILATIFLITIASHAEAGPTSAKEARDAPVFDVASVPAYPTDGNGNAVDRRSSRSLVRAANGGAGSGIVRSKKTGATARVASRYAGVFQSYVDALEARGAAIYYMGGKRPGRCWEGSQHPCGTALDVCQDWRGHVSAVRDCALPGPVEMAAIAKSVGLFEGGVWCGRPDYGHVQVVPTGTVCAARGTFGPRRHRVADRTGGRL